MAFFTPLLGRRRSSNRSSQSSTPSATNEYVWFCGGYGKKDVNLLRCSFYLVAENCDSIGKEAFTDLFEQDRETFKLFVNGKVLPNNANEIENSWETLAHSKRVLSGIEKAVNRIDNKEHFLEYISQFAQKHIEHGVTNRKSILTLLGCLRRSMFKLIKKAPGPRIFAIHCRAKISRRCSEPTSPSTKSLSTSNLQLMPNHHRKVMPPSNMTNVPSDDSSSSDSDNDDVNHHDAEDTCSEDQRLECIRTKLCLVWDRFFVTFSLAFVNAFERAQQRPQTLTVQVSNSSNSSQYLQQNSQHSGLASPSSWSRRSSRSPCSPRIPSMDRRKSSLSESITALILNSASINLDCVEHK